VAFILASGLETGSVSALSYALVFWQLPFGIFSASVTTVLFPKMSRQAGNDDREGLKDSVQYGLRFLFVLLVPSALFLSFFGLETVSMALQRGKFTADNTLMTASVLTGYCWGLFSVGAFTFLQRFFYSVRNYRLPFIVAALVAIVDITLSIILKETSLGVTGLSVANSVSFTLGTVLLLVLAAGALGGLPLRSFLFTGLKVFVSLIPASVFALLARSFFGSWWIEGSYLAGFTYLAGEVIIMIMLILAMYKITGIEMMNSILSRFSDRRRS
jgi:putative peptidoglycan lipid II flippase